MVTHGEEPLSERRRCFKSDRDDDGTTADADGADAGRSTE